MKAIEYRTVDKSTWDRGPWDDEPDKAQFIDTTTGMPALILRNDMGALCGYVGVTEGHPAFGKDYDELDAIDVHGGLTFADKCHPHPEGESRGICHVPGEGEPDHVWWLGFDCAHCDDVMPAYDARTRRFASHQQYGSYKTIGFVKGQIASLAAQLKATQP